MLFYIYTEDNEWALVDFEDIIYKKGLNNWYHVDNTQERIFHQRLGSSWQPITQKEQKLYRPSYYY